MKKFLSLVLALVMTMSLVTVASAKDYADANKITYVEAVDVLSTLGVLEGDAAGFRPTDTLKRSEAAKIICALNLTPDVAATLSADSAPFADVAKSHWAAGYIAEGVQSGIIAGVGDNKFDPDGKLTGYAYLKMLLVCLGYDAAVEGMTGANWSVNVAKLAKKAGLTDGNDDFVGSKAVTREEAALYALNALEANTVEYESKGTQISINGAVIATGATAAKYVTDEDGKKVPYMDEVYGDDLVKATVSGGDDLGRPAHQWKYDGDKVGTYADTADYTLTLTDTLTGIDSKYTTLAKYLDGEEILEDAEYDDNVKMYVNGVKKTDEANLAMAAGSIVEVFADDEVIETIVVVNYSLAKITKVNTEVNKAAAKEGVTAYITAKDLDSKVVINAEWDTEIAGYDADTYVKNAYILYAKNGDGDVVASELAEVVEGTVTAKSGSKVAVDGTYYKNVSGKTIEKKAEGQFFLNAAGQIMAFDAENAGSDTYAYVYNTKSGSKNSDGVTGNDVIYVVLTDGTKASYTLSDDTEVKPEIGGVYPFSLDDDEIIFEDVTDRDDDITITTTEEAVTIDKKNPDVGDIDLLSTTEFIFAYWNSANTKLTVKTATGYKNVNVTATVTVVADDGDALFVFVGEKNKSVTTDTEYAVLLSDDVVETWDDDDTYYTYTVAVDGKETELTVEDGNEITEDELVEGAVYAFVMDGDYAVFEEDEDGKTVIVGQYKTLQATTVNDDYFKAGGTRYEYDEETYYTITMEKDIDGDLESVTVDKGAELEEDDYVVVITDDGDLSIVFVYNIIE